MGVLLDCFRLFTSHWLACCRCNRGTVVWKGQSWADHGHLELTHICGQQCGICFVCLSGEIRMGVGFSSARKLHQRVRHSVLVLPCATPCRCWIPTRPGRIQHNSNKRPRNPTSRHTLRLNCAKGLMFVGSDGRTKRYSLDDGVVDSWRDSLFAGVVF